MVPPDVAALAVKIISDPILKSELEGEVRLTVNGEFAIVTEMLWLSKELLES